MALPWQTERNQLDMQEPHTGTVNILQEGELLRHSMLEYLLQR